MKILNKINTDVYDYVFVPIYYVCNNKNLNELNIAINNHIFKTNNHAMWWACNKDHPVI